MVLSLNRMNRVLRIYVPIRTDTICQLELRRYGHPDKSVGPAALVSPAAVGRIEVVHSRAHEILTRHGERGIRGPGAIPLSKPDILGGTSTATATATGPGSSSGSPGTASSNSSGNSSRVWSNAAAPAATSTTALTRLRKRVGLMPREFNSSRTLELGPRHVDRSGVPETKIVLIPLRRVPRVD